MAQKQQSDTVVETFVPEVDGSDMGNGEGAGEVKLETNFDLEAEHKDAPLIPQGTYTANVIDTKFDSEAQTIEWVFTLVDNGGVMSDGETSVDGVMIATKNWLPKEGDENELTKSGKMTKRQAKINMLFNFLKDMGCPEKTSDSIDKALNNKEWVGKRAKLQIGLRTYEGRIFNEVKRAVAA